MFGVVTLDVVHEPVEDLDVTMDGDVHLVPALRVHREIFFKVTHLSHQEVSWTHKVLLQVLCFVTYVNYHVGTVEKESQR